MKNALLALLFAGHAMTLSAQTELSSDFTISDTLLLSGSPYTVTGNITVLNAVTLKIDSGVVLKFNQHLGLYVQGNLIANGVLFTSSASQAAKGDWSQIYIQNTGTANL